MSVTGRIAEIRRHPVKGFTPERLAEVELEAGGGFPCDRIWAVERGVSGFDPSAPRHVSKWRFAVLANHARLAQAVTRYDEATSTLNLAVGGPTVLEADLSKPEGREMFAQWLGRFLGEAEDEALRVVSSGGAHRFTDDADGFVSVVNLQSVRDLEARLGLPVDPLRFRANLYVEGWPAWAETRAPAGASLTLGAVRAVLVKPIQRCVAVDVDPATGERDLDVLGALRQHYGHVNCGLYLKVVSPGRLAEGDPARLN